MTVEPVIGSRFCTRTPITRLIDMAYFSNGTEGDMFQEQWCNRCIHDSNNDCPVWNAHLAFDYEQLKEGKEELRQLLEMLIPMKDKIWPDKCKMFVEIK